MQCYFWQQCLGNWEEPVHVSAAWIVGSGFNSKSNLSFLYFCFSSSVCVCVCGSIDRIQQLRREYQQARREGIVPPYEELDPRRRGHENDTHRVRSSDTTHTHTRALTCRWKSKFTCTLLSLTSKPSVHASVSVQCAWVYGRFLQLSERSLLFLRSSRDQGPLVVSRQVLFDVNGSCRHWADRTWYDPLFTEDETQRR